MLSVDQQRRRIALGLKQLEEDPWATDIPDKYQPGQVVTGTVTKLTNFGVFVGLENGLEGLLHISELADHKVENPEEIVKVGDKIEVKILRSTPTSARSACRASASNGPRTTDRRPTRAGGRRPAPACDRGTLRQRTEGRRRRRKRPADQALATPNRRKNP